MRAYALAKLIQVAGGVDARTRLQKCIFLLQEAGLDFGASYSLHYYGPYSRDVAETTDRLAQADILEETMASHQLGERYSYRVTSSGAGLLDAVETSPEEKKALEAMNPFFDLINRLGSEPLRNLELAATMVFFHRHGPFDWETAKARTAKFKNENEEAALSQAEKLARELLHELQ